MHVINAKDNFVQAMTISGEAAKLLELAADAQGVERAELAARTKAILNAATEIFDRGYADYVEAQSKAGAVAPPAPGVPGATGTSCPTVSSCSTPGPSTPGCGSRSSPPSRMAWPSRRPTSRGSGAPSRPEMS